MIIGLLLLLLLVQIFNQASSESCTMKAKHLHDLVKLTDKFIREIQQKSNVSILHGEIFFFAECDNHFRIFIYCSYKNIMEQLRKLHVKFRIWKLSCFERRNAPRFRW